MKRPPTWGAMYLPRRQYRQEDEEKARRGSGKRTARWCRGRRGVRHLIGGWEPDPGDFSWRERRRCYQCGKVYAVRHHLRNGWREYILCRQMVAGAS